MADIPEGQTKRKRGHPRRGEEPVTPQVLEGIADMFLKGVSMSRIGKAYGIDPKTVMQHLESKIRPLWREQMTVKAEEELAKVATLEAVAWEKWKESQDPMTVKKVRKELEEAKVEKTVRERIVTKRTGEACWLDIVRWSIEHRAKIAGLYAPERHRVEHSGEIRVAGQSPEEFDAETIRLLMERIKERQVTAEAVKARWN